MPPAVELSRSELDEWDRFVEGHPLGWICHLSDWQRVLEASFPHITGHVLVVRDGSAIRAGTPVCEVRCRLLGNRLVSTPYGTLCCPLASDGEDTERLAEAVLELARQKGARCVEIRSLGRLPIGAAGRFVERTRYKHHFLEVKDEPEKLRRRFDRSCVRQRIDRALKSGVEVATVDDERGLRDFYGLYVKTRKRLGLPPQPYRFIRSLWAAFWTQRRVEVHLASYRGAPVAGILLLCFNGRMSAEYLVSDGSHQGLSPGHLLVWNAIRQAHERGCGIFDFGRTDATDASLINFKQKWGTQAIDLPVYYHPKSRLERFESWRAALRPAIRWTLRRLPDRSHRWIGDVFYRHMG